MNPVHLRAFLWLRYRLFVNQIAKGGITNSVILAIGAAAGIISVISLTLSSFFIGWLAMNDVSPTWLMLIWDGIALVFFFSWSIGLLSELQRSEVLSVEKFLHLPVSVAGVFGLNYLSSLFSINLILLAPAMFGLCLGLALARGPALLLVLPLIVSYLLMVTALSYQFQGWLASLMVDKRRRRTVIMVVTLGFILMCQLPNLLNIFRPWQSLSDGVNQRNAAEQIENRRARDAGEITIEEFQRRQIQTQARRKADSANSNEAALEQVDAYATFFNTIVPLGWLPLGIRGATEGNVLPAIFGTLAYTIIGGASLWRAYRTTLRLYTGYFSKGQTRTATQPVISAPAEIAGETLLARRLPWFSEQASVVALAGFRSLTRAPESKMLLLTPFMLLVIAVGAYFRISDEFPMYVRPLIAFSGMSLILITLTQWVGNQFGFDRAGFRVFVLSPAPRREILLGKNLAVAPVALTLCVVTACLVQVLFPMRLDHFLALFPQVLSMYLLFCMLANFLSIYAPMPIAAGTTKPANTKLIPVLLNMLFMGGFALALGPTNLPLGIEAALDALGWVENVPICLLLAMVVCAAVIALYYFVLGWQGTLLQGREQTILEAVTTKAE